MNLQIRSSNKSESITNNRLMFVTEEMIADQKLDLEEQFWGQVINFEELKGSFGEITAHKVIEDQQQYNLIVAGLGKKAEVNLEKLRQATGKALKEADRLKIKQISVLPFKLNMAVVDQIRALVEAALLVNYRFDKYLSEKKQLALAELIVVYENGQGEEVELGIAQGKVLAEATALARDLVNEPANVLTPAKLADYAVQAGEEAGFVVKVFEEEQIAELKMDAFLAVAQATVNRPRLIVMRYFGDKQNQGEVLGLVGKGLTYDSGGLSIKPGDSMITMKSDMAGAAAVIGAMSAIAQQNLKVNVVAVIAACENLISGTGYRPGDIINTMAGKSVFISSTDAEGRLTLADAIHYIIEHEGASRVVDIATLTGAAIIALGHTTTGVLTNNQDFYKQLEQAAELSGEKVWQLPSFPEYKELNKSPIADLKNTGGRAAGTITAGLFLGEFVQDKPWLHLDIAGTSYASKDWDYGVEGGTGVGVRLLYHLAETFAEK